MGDWTDREWEIISHRLDNLTPEELLVLLTPRELIKALRVWEKNNPDKPILLFDEQGKKRG